MHSSHHWRGEREGSEGDKIGISIDPEQPDGREGTAMLGTKRGRDRRLTTPPAPKRSSQPSHKLQLKPTKIFEKFSRECRCNRRNKNSTSFLVKRKRSVPSENLRGELFIKATAFK